MVILVSTRYLRVCLTSTPDYKFAMGTFWVLHTDSAALAAAAFAAAAELSGDAVRILIA